MEEMSMFINAFEDCETGVECDNVEEVFRILGFFNE